VAVTSPKRNAALPEVPTVMESGYRYEVNNWHGLMGPKGLPKAIVDKLNSEINTAIRDPDFAQRIASEGLMPAGGPPEKLLTLLRNEIADWAKVVKQTGLKAGD
jgi:tripartite-type tricarboxylate transporter receptor subunit TctC